MRYKYDTPSITWKSTGPNHFFFHNKECSLKKKKKQKTIAANWPFRHWRMVESFFFPFFVSLFFVEGVTTPLRRSPTLGSITPTVRTRFLIKLSLSMKRWFFSSPLFFFMSIVPTRPLDFVIPLSDWPDQWEAPKNRSGDLEVTLRPGRYRRDADKSINRGTVRKKKNQKQKMATTSLYLQVPSRTPCGWWPQPPQAKQLQKKTTRLTQPDSDSLSSHWLPPRAIDLPGTRWVVLGFTGL